MSKPNSNNTSPLRERVSAVAARLAAAELDEAGAKAEWLVAHAAGVERLDLYRDGPGVDEERLDRLVRRLMLGEPIQYIVGTVNFRGHILSCDRRALIPRPETEELVEVALRAPGLRFADVCTGGGCIAVAIARERPGARVRATDISDDALSLARENAARIGVSGRIEFEKVDLLQGQPPASLDVVVANPPYIATDEIEDLQIEVRDFEPRIALDGGRDGMRLIARLLPQAFQSLEAGGRLVMEVGETQAGAVRALMNAAGFVEAAVFRDLAGHDRILQGTRP